MEHFDEGKLRRFIDEPESLDEQAKRHIESCAACRAQRDALSRDAEFARSALRANANVDLTSARTRLDSALFAPRRRARWYLPAGLAVAAAFALALVFTPLGGYASAFLTMFQPKEFVPIDISHADFRQLRLAPDAKELGTIRVLRKQVRTTYATLDGARANLTFAARVPAQIPSGIGARRSFSVQTPGEYQYTFSAAKAQAFEAKSHKTLPPMPPALNGTAVHIGIGQVFSAEYGVPKKQRDEEEQHEGLVVVEMQIPTVTSHGASFQSLERYMLSLPGISPDLAAQLRELGDLQNRMPVPVDISKQTAHEVAVDGVQGLAIGDNTGLGAGVMWQKNGIVYAVMGGALTMDQVLALANGLH